MTTKRVDGLSAKKHYDRNHPGISIRLTKEEKVKLDAIIEREGVTASIIVKRCLSGYVENQEAREKELEDAFEVGREKGYSEAKDNFLIEVPCSICKKLDNMIPVLKGDDIHSKLVRRGIFTHPECERRMRSSHGRRSK